MRRRLSRHAVDFSPLQDEVVQILALLLLLLELTDDGAEVFLIL